MTKHFPGCKIQIGRKAKWKSNVKSICHLSPLIFQTFHSQQVCNKSIYRLINNTLLRPSVTVLLRLALLTNKAFIWQVFLQKQPPEVFCGKRCSECKFIKNETLQQVFFCEFCKIFKNTIFTEHLSVTASVSDSFCLQKLKTKTLNEIYLLQT